MNNTYRALIQERGKNLIEKSCIYYNFPKEGIKFIDIFPMLQQFKFTDVKEVFDVISEPIILVPEARGFLFYQVLGPEKCLPLRKKGKMPGKVISIPITKEYGKDVLCFQEEALINIVENLNWKSKGTPIPICFFDDVLATGGTASGVINYFNNYCLNDYTFKVVTARFYIELKDLPGKDNLAPVNIESVYTY